jgi:hypothetical protein
MTTLTQANTEWKTRPEDERFLSLTDLHAHCERSRSESRAFNSSSRHYQVVPRDTHTDLCVQDADGTVALTHWSFGQLAQRAGAPAGYLRELPSPMAADCINWGLRHARSVQDLGYMIARPTDGDPILKAVTGPTYGRIWNADITQSLCDRFGDGVTGNFRVPGEFGRQVSVTKDNTTLFASDRDMFVFLADEQHGIELPNRRDGRTGSLARGFFVWNSEVGAATFGIGTFLFDYVCSNRIVWGAHEFKEIKIRHTSGAPDRYIHELAPALRDYAESSTANVTHTLMEAQRAKIDNVDDFLAKRFTKQIVSGIQRAHEKDEGRPIETIWDVTTGVTAYARSLSHQDERVTLERQAGKILDLVS